MRSAPSSRSTLTAKSKRRVDLFLVWIYDLCDEEKQSTVTFMPGVVEPSFGIDRILFSLLEHSYYARPKALFHVGRSISGDDRRKARVTSRFGPF